MDTGRWNILLMMLGPLKKHYFMDFFKYSLVVQGVLKAENETLPLIFPSFDHQQVIEPSRVLASSSGQ